MRERTPRACPWEPSDGELASEAKTVSDEWFKGLGILTEQDKMDWLYFTDGKVINKDLEDKILEYYLYRDLKLIRKKIADGYDVHRAAALVCDGTAIQKFIDAREPSRTYAAYCAYI